MELFGRYYRTGSTNIAMLPEELSADLDPHWEEKYKVDETTDSTELVELEIQTPNMNVRFYQPHKGISAYVTPTVGGRTENATYDDFEECDLQLEQYLNKYFEPISR